MKFNFFKSNSQDDKKTDSISEELDEFGLSKSESIEYDKNVAFYYNNLINSLILFSLTEKELENLAGPFFNPMSELEMEIDYAFTPVCFETIFRNKLVDCSLKVELLEFKKSTDEIPLEIWDWEFIDNHKTWKRIRQTAKTILNKLNVTNLVYNEDYTVIYNNEGKILKKGKKYT